MAIQFIKMAFQDIAMDVRYVFHNLVTSNRAYTVGMHAHDFVHIDFILSGTVDVAGEEFDETLRAGDCVILPARTAHGFRYPRKGIRWLSVKFLVEGIKADLAVLRDSPFLQHVVGAATQLATPFMTQNEQEALALLAASVLAHYADEQDSDRSHTPFVDRIMQEIRHNEGREMRIDELAHKLHYSTGRLSARFSAEYGTPLKTVIDEERSAVAGRLLRYSDQTISQIADRLDFRDVYAFSRFFKRLNGVSPRAYRKQYSRSV